MYLTLCAPRDKLLPLLKEYRELADEAIDGLQDTLARIDKAVDETIHINGWASFQLTQIDERASSPFAPIRELAARYLPQTTGHERATSEAEIRTAMVQLTDRVQERLGVVLFDMRKHGDTLRRLQDVLDNIAITALGDRAKLQRTRLKEMSYWQWILKSYRDKMMDFDQKMAICAAFYEHVEQASQVVTVTRFKMGQMRSQLVHFRDVLQEAPLYLEGGQKGALQLYIKMLDSGVATLEATKKSTKVEKADKVKKLEVKLKASAR